MSDQTRRIFIDSRHKLPTSVSNGQFEVSLPFAVHVPAGTQVYIDNLVLSHSWPTVSAANCNIFLKETVGGVHYHRMLVLSHGTYTIGTLAAELQAKLRAGSYIQDGLYTVGHQSNRMVITTSTVTASSTAYIYSFDDVHSKNAFNLNGFVVDGVAYAQSSDFSIIWRAATVVSPGTVPNPVADANEMMGLMHTGAIIHMGGNERLAHVDLQRHKALYLCSHDLGESTTLDLKGNTNVIRKINVGASQTGDVIIDTLQSNVCFSVYRIDSVLKHLAFTIRSFDGEAFDFYDHQVSFEIILARPSDR